MIHAKHIAKGAAKKCDQLAPRFGTVNSHCKVTFRPLRPNTRLKTVKYAKYGIWWCIPEKMLQNAVMTPWPCVKSTPSQKLWPNLIFGRLPLCNHNVKLKSAGVFLFMGLLIWNFFWCIYTPFGSSGLEIIARFKKKRFFLNTLLNMKGCYTNLWLKMANLLFKLERTGWSDRQASWWVGTMGVIGRGR